LPNTGRVGFVTENIFLISGATDGERMRAVGTIAHRQRAAGQRAIGDAAKAGHRRGRRRVAALDRRHGGGRRRREAARTQLPRARRVGALVQRRHRHCLRLTQRTHVFVRLDAQRSVRHIKLFLAPVNTNQHSLSNTLYSVD
jgi:hypothetical protein